MVRILALSFLFKGESFSFVRGLWLLDLDNRKTFLVDISWISFASGVLRWWLESLLLPRIREIFVRSIYFFGNLSCLQEGNISLGVFAGAPQLAWIGFVCIKGYSFVSLWSMIYSCYFFYSICFFLMMQQIWYGWRLLCRREGAVASWGKTLGIELTQIFSQWSG